MDRLIAIPKRDFGEMYGEKPTAISSDLFVSIPRRDLFSCSLSRNSVQHDGYSCRIRQDSLIALNKS